MGMIISDDHAAEDSNTRRQAIFGDQEVAGAIVRREVMLQLLRAAASNTPSDERLVRLLQAVCSATIDPLSLSMSEAKWH